MEREEGAGASGSWGGASRAWRECARIQGEDPGPRQVRLLEQTLLHPVGSLPARSLGEERTEGAAQEAGRQSRLCGSQTRETSTSASGPKSVGSRLILPPQCAHRPSNLGTAPRWLGGEGPINNGGDEVSIPGSGRSPGEGNGNPLQHPCLENPMDGELGGRQSIGSQKSWTQQSD